MVQVRKQFEMEAIMIDFNFPKTLPAFNAKFFEETACQKFLFDQKWPEGFCCGKCGCRRASYLSTRRAYQCLQCGFQHSLIVGTIFEQSKKPLMQWFLAIFHFTNTKGGLSAKALQRLMGFGSYQTAWAWLHKIREAMKRSRTKKIMGPVEVDEAYVGGPKSGKAGRGAQGKMLVGCAIESNGKAIGRVKFGLLEKADRAQLSRFVRNHVKKAAEVTTDEWGGYNNLLDDGFLHYTTQDAVADLPAAHRVFSLLKRWLLGTHHGSVSKKHFPAYLEEFSFRFNRRRAKSPCYGFAKVMERVVMGKPKTYTEIVGQNGNSSFF